MDPTRALAEFGGAARRDELLVRGVSRRALASAQEQGAVVRAHRGCYALPETPPEFVLAKVFRASVSCVSACAYWGMPLIEGSTRPHLAVPTNRSPGPPGPRPTGQVVLHRVTGPQLPSPVTDILTAIDHTYRCLTREQQLVLVDHALHEGLIDLWQLRDMCTTPKSRRQWLRDHADGRAESLLETLARVAVRAAGLAVETQVAIAGVGRVDLVVGGKVVIELDGRAYHANDTAFIEDRRRDRELTKLGYKVLRYTYRDVVFDVDQLVSDVAHLLHSLKVVPSQPDSRPEPSRLRVRALA